MTGPEPIRAPILGEVPHGFFGRQGGVSTGAVASLNAGLGSADDPAHVAENRRRAGEAVLPGAPLVGLYQVHSADAVVVEAPWADIDRPRADALVTDRSGLLLAILTADCAPILLADVEAGVVGAAHAGWRGAVGGVIEATVARMVALGARPHRIAAAIGPTIRQPSYEVDAGFRAHLAAGDERFLAPAARPGHLLFDLPGYALARLERAGVRAVSIGLDTYADEARFFSFRRATHRGEPDYGRQVALIGVGRE